VRVSGGACSPHSITDKDKKISTMATTFQQLTTFRGTPAGTYIHLTILLTKVSKKRILKIRKDRVQYIAIQKKRKMVFYECVVTARNTASKSSQPTLRFSNNINITVPSSLSLSNTMHQHSSPQILLI